MTLLALGVAVQVSLPGCKTSSSGFHTTPDRCGEYLHLTPTSNYCVSMPKEVDKVIPNYIKTNRSIRGRLGKESCLIRKGEYVTLLPPGGVAHGVKESFFASIDGCVISLKWDFLG